MHCTLTRLLVLVLLLNHLHATAQLPPPATPASDSRLQQFIEQSRRDATAKLDPAALQQLLRQRQDLLKSGEAALIKGQTDAAEKAFDRAALIEHAADTEMALVRTYMQAGNYRRASVFAAHTAGAHRQVVGGAVLYAWLLYQGGQEGAAKQLLAQAAQTFAADAQLQGIQRLLARPGDLPSGAQLSLPARLAPYSTGSAVPSSARVASSGVLLPGGGHALVPLAAIGTADSPLWLRSGLGQTRQASVAKRLPDLGLALVKLSSKLPTRKSLPIPSRDPFPGSPAYALQYTANPGNEAAWPRIYAGLQGMPVGSSGLRSLSIVMPPAGANEPRGGPVLDAAGRWVGVALSATGGKDQVVMASQLRSALGPLLDGPAPLPAPGAAASAAVSVSSAASAGAARAPLDEVYENALHMSLQVITKPR